MMDGYGSLVQGAIMYNYDGMKLTGPQLVCVDRVSQQFFTGCARSLSMDIDQGRVGDHTDKTKKTWNNSECQF
jgi:hypothetical protein